MTGMKIPSCILITGANIGLGFECARQLGLVEGVQKILLACRSQEKATAAKERLEQLTNKKIFEVILMDVSSLASVKKAIETLKDEAIIDGVVLNAGGGRGGITCSGYPGRPPPSPPPSSCSSHWPQQIVFEPVHLLLQLGDQPLCELGTSLSLLALCALRSWTRRSLRAPLPSPGQPQP